jgi:radical SAM/Cys-rich protein
MKSLKSRGSSLTDSLEQLRLLNEGSERLAKLPSFESKMASIGLAPLKATGIGIFQVNVGKMCNQTCKHCHVDAGPDRKEIMTRETMQLCLDAIRETDIKTVDLTGGAPEMNPHFRWFVEEISKLGRETLVRCNLTIILANKVYNDLPDFFAKHRVHVVSSLPHYDKRNTDRQRGDGVFEKSIKALKMLNDVGYGKPGTGLLLDLVYNPAGAFLPGGQQQLEADFKKELKSLFDIEFNQLFTITNMPISRYLEYLIESENLEDYMEKLVNAFNPGAAQNVMCRNTLSVSWDGFLYDCDFNQMMDLKTVSSAPQHLRDFNRDLLDSREIVLNQHCYGCTAGSGSSCGGELTAK